MAPMARKEYEDTYHVKQIEYLVHYNDNLTIGQKVLKYEVITKAMSLNLDQAAIDNFFAQPEVQDKIRDKQWYTRRVMASNISTTANNPPIINNPPTNEEDGEEEYEEEENDEEDVPSPSTNISSAPLPPDNVASSHSADPQPIPKI
jgi:hypothetical protein